MNKDDIKRIIDNPELIPGIYNYCDRWCERCPMTSRCATFVMEKEQYPDGIDDLGNEVFWEKLSEIFKATMEMVVESAEEMGIDLDNLDDDDFEAAEEKVEGEIEQNYCANVSKDYMNNVPTWFEEAKDLLKNKEKELNKNLEMGIENEAGARLLDIIDIIHWYQHQIHVKIRRALHSKFDPMGEDPDYPKDSDGSAKVSLIGIDRSLAAWGKMLTFFPEKEDDTLAILVTLEKLRRNVEKEFPDARAFVRAGFDE